MTRDSRNITNNQSQAPKRFEVSDWFTLVVAAVLGAFLLPHIAGTIYLAFTATVLAGPEPVIIVGGLIFLVGMAAIVYWKLKKLQSVSSAQTYRTTARLLSALVIFIAGILYARIF